jgi:hypothetical protein
MDQNSMNNSLISAQKDGIDDYRFKDDDLSDIDTKGLATWTTANHTYLPKYMRVLY